MKEEKIEQKLLEIFGTHPGDIKQADLVRLVPDLSAATLARLVPYLSAATLARLVPYLSAATLARLVPDLSAATLARLVPYLSAATLARLVPYLSAATLDRLVPDLSAATLARLVPDLSAATLARLVPYLSAATLARLEIKRGSIPKLKNPYTSILNAINSEGCTLNMREWHTCETTHCLAGWTVHLAGAPGYALEKSFIHDGTPGAAALILRNSRPDAPLPNFYASNDQAMAFIKARALEEK